MINYKDKVRSRCLGYVMEYKEILYRLVCNGVKGRTNSLIADMGCRWGEDLSFICSKTKSKGIGLDMEPKQQWKTAALSCSFLVSLAESIALKDQTLDVLMSSEMIEHISDPGDFLKQAFRVLKPGGFLCLTTPPRYNYTTLIGKLIPGIFKSGLRQFVYFRHSKDSGIKSRLKDGTIVREHIHEFLPDELSRIIQENGFQVRQLCQGYLYIPCAPLFECFPFLITLWKGFDRLISLLPKAINFKANFLIIAQKPPVTAWNIEKSW